LLLFFFKCREELAELLFIEILVEELKEEAKLEYSDETSDFGYSNCQVLWVPVIDSVFLGEVVVYEDFTLLHIIL
jgi:hypothetical protein